MLTRFHRGVIVNSLKRETHERRCNMENIKAQKEQDVTNFMREMQCSETVARAYLSADNWLYFDAMDSLRLDRKAGMSGE